MGAGAAPLAAGPPPPAACQPTAAAALPFPPAAACFLTTAVGRNNRAAMSELRKALAALGGHSVSSPGPHGGAADATTPRALSPGMMGAHPSWFVPPHLLRLPQLQAAAFAAHAASREACTHPSDFDRVYRFALSLQASVCGCCRWWAGSGPRAPCRVCAPQEPRPEAPLR